MNIGTEGKAFVAEPIEAPDAEERTIDAPAVEEVELVPVARVVAEPAERELV